MKLKTRLRLASHFAHKVLVTMGKKDFPLAENVYKGGSFRYFEIIFRYEGGREVITLMIDFEKRRPKLYNLNYKKELDEFYSGFISWKREDPLEVHVFHQGMDFPLGEVNFFPLALIALGLVEELPGVELSAHEIALALSNVVDWEKENPVESYPVIFDPYT